MAPRRPTPDGPLHRGRLSTTRRGAAAFTLVELLVVVAVVAVLVGLLLPALGKARAAGQGAVSLSNLRQCGVIQFAYAADSKDSFVNPFGPSAIGVPWYDVVAPRSVNAPAGSGAWVWDFSDGDWTTELFAAHWLSLLTQYLTSNNLYSTMLIAPNDLAAQRRFRELMPKVSGARATGTSDSSRDGFMFDTSYWYSPTFWFSSSRYRGAESVPVNESTGARLWRRNRVDHVVMPQAKVMIFERMDFTQKDRVGKAGGREPYPPSFNNPRATTRFVTADGSVSSVEMDTLHALTNASATRSEDVDVYTPSGRWNVPDSILGDPDRPLSASNYNYGLGRDGLENGDGQLSRTPGGFHAYPAFFWATRHGVQGRDIPR